MATAPRATAGVIDFSKTFGGKAAPAAAEQREKAQFWMNLGYHVDVTVEGEAGPEQQTRFVSLPIGLPLDGMEPVKVNGNNASWRAFQEARNSLLKQLQDGAQGLEPGEERLVQLDVVIRRVKGEDQTPAIADEANPFVAGFNAFAPVG